VKVIPWQHVSARHANAQCFFNLAVVSKMTLELKMRLSMDESRLKLDDVSSVLAGRNALSAMTQQTKMAFAAIMTC
jgi:hypothetical protein